MSRQGGSKPNLQPQALPANRADTQSALAAFVSTSGYILAVSYPVLALSTGTRAVYQLFFKGGVSELLPPLLSLVAAICYLLATVGFVRPRERAGAVLTGNWASITDVMGPAAGKWRWWLSMLSLGIETVLTLVVGVWSYVDPDLIGRTVWRHFGADYGYFPLFQPLIGLVWLLWPATLAMYGIRSSGPVTHVSRRRSGSGPAGDASSELIS